jgi:hypothetical protein
MLLISQKQAIMQDFGELKWSHGKLYFWLVHWQYRPLN